MTFLVIHPLGETLKIDDPYDTLACFSPSKIHDFSWFSRHVSLPFFTSILDDILHRCWRHFGVLLASKSAFFNTEFLMTFYAPRLPADPLTRSVHLRSAILSILLIGAPHPAPRNPTPTPHPTPPQGPKGPWALWGYSEVISNGWLFRWASHFEWKGEI